MRDRLRPFGVRVAGLAAVGAVVRALYTFVYTPHIMGFGDWAYYNGVANLIAEGRWFIDPFAAGEGDTIPSASHPPLYPLVLSAISLLGGTGWRSHRSLGVVLGAASVVLLALLARRVAGERAGLVAGALAALHPLLVAADGALLSETLYTPLLAGVLLCAYRLYDEPGTRWALALGALIALAALTRSEALLLLGVLVIPVALRHRPRWWLRAGAAGLACLVVLAPWTIRNWDAFGRPVPISTQDGALIAGANCPDTYSGPDMGGWSFACLSERVDLNEAVQGDIWRREGIEYARENADRIPAVVGMRVLKLLDFYDPGYQLQFAEGRDRGFQRLGVGLYYLLLPLAIAGGLLLRRRGEPLRVLVGPLVMVGLSAVLFYGVTRLRHAADVVIVVLAAVALAELWARLARRSEASGRGSAPTGPPPARPAGSR